MAANEDKKPETRNLVLTGASRGIGHATVKRFMRGGWNIITVSRDSPPPECGRIPGWSHHVTADLSLPADRERLIADVNAHLGDAKLHALVNNAGVSPKTSYKERLGVLHGPLEEWHAVFELNFYAPIALARGFAAALARGRGSIVNVTSIAGHAIHPFAGSAYSTSKAALSSLTREMASELAPLGIRVNAVAPGEIETEMISADYEPLVTRIPMQRMGTTEEVAGVIYQLCEADFGYVTGSEIFITGGQHLL
jgi:NAD(P)-dependent dehydrogenase (short-subunit alcohol dehydrogenase family)